jgi:hypothetical protein
LLELFDGTQHVQDAVRMAKVVVLTLSGRDVPSKARITIDTNAVFRHCVT